MKRRFRRRPIVPATLAVALVALVLLRWFQEARVPQTPEIIVEGSAELDRVIDGDTLSLVNGARIRLIGVDTPESNLFQKPRQSPEPFAHEATRFTKDFLARGPLRLEFDLERKDRFDRFLAYVWVEDRMLNEELLRAGLARARLEFHYSGSKKRVFRKTEEEARRAKRGIWQNEEVLE